jgi:hypothetical protein
MKMVVFSIVGGEATVCEVVWMPRRGDRLKWYDDTEKEQSNAARTSGAERSSGRRGRTRDGGIVGECRDRGAAIQR